jgi:hypothetical protein
MSIQSGGERHLRRRAIEPTGRTGLIGSGSRDGEALILSGNPRVDGCDRHKSSRLSAGAISLSLLLRLNSDAFKMNRIMKSQLEVLLMPNIQRLVLGCVFILLLTSRSAPAASPPAAIEGVDHVRAIGDVAVNQGAVTAKGPKTTLLIGPDDAINYRVTAQVKAGEKVRRVMVYVMPADPADLARQAALYAAFYRDAAGSQFITDTSVWDPTSQQWASNNDATWYTYWPLPTDQSNLARIETSGIAPRKLDDHRFTLRIEADRRRVRCWLEGRTSPWKYPPRKSATTM